MKDIKELYYFGTSLNESGHYFWKLSENSIRECKHNEVYFDNLPFDPENLIDYVPKGSVNYFKFNEYTVCAIEGSCRDKRPGSHSIFWTKETIEFSDFKKIILSIPIAKKIIETMPFEVKW